MGIEWELVELLLEIYRVFVTGLDLKAFLGQNPDLAAVLSLSDCSPLPAPLDEGPRRCLLATNLLSQQQLLQFESDLSKIQVTSLPALVIANSLID